MAFKSSKGRDAGKELEVLKSSSIGLGVAAEAAAPTAPTVFLAIGGQESTPGDGYKYHVYDTTDPSIFYVVNEGDGTKTLNVMVQGSGMSGRSGLAFGDAPGGGGGGGGATGVWNIPNIEKGPYSTTIGAGGAAGNGNPGNYSRFTDVDNSVYLQAGGGGASASTNTDPWPGITIAENYPGAAADPPNGHPFGGTGGKPAGGQPQPGVTKWWRPYIAPGTGGGAAPTSGYPGGDGNPYGGGGGGGGGQSGGGTPAKSGGAGADGRVVIRYSV